MSNTNAAYEANVRKIAAEMAANTTENKGPSYINNEEWIEWFLPAARIAVTKLGEVAKDFHYAGWTTRGLYEGPAEGARTGQLEYMLEQRGLIPSPHQPEGTNHED